MKAWSARGMAAAEMALLALWASSPATAAKKDPEWAVAQPIVSTTLAHGLRSSYVRPSLLLAGSSCQWQAAMAALVATQSLEAGPEPEPAVNWNLQSVVVVAMGSVPYGYDLSVLGARLSPRGKLLLDVHVDYQSVENSLENVTPVVVLVVDGIGITDVEALYDLNPGLVSQASAPACSPQRIAAGLGGSERDREPGVAVAETWGALKSLYR